MITTYIIGAVICTALFGILALISGDIMRHPVKAPATVAAAALLWPTTLACLLVIWWIGSDITDGDAR